MAEVAGSVHDLAPLAAPPAPSPHTGGKVTVIGARAVTGAIALSPTTFGAGVHDSSGGITPPAPSNVEVSGQKSDLTPGHLWFERVHALPREPIDFGNIITTVEDVFELFSAFTSQVTLTTFVNNAGTGVEVPDLPTLPYIMDPFTSILGPTSTRLSPVALAVQALAEGPAQFDDTLDFTFAPGGLLAVRVQGNRIAYIPFDYEEGYEEYWDFGGEVIERIDGTEQRIDPRAYFRQSFDLLYLLDGRQKRRMRALLFDWQARQFALPIKNQGMRITADVSSGLTVQVDSTAGADLRVGSLAVLQADDDTFDVLTVDSLTSTSITFTSAIQESYDADAQPPPFAYPVRLVRGPSNQRGSRPPVNLERFRFPVEVVDNHTGLPTGDTSAYSSYGGKVLLDDCNVVDREADIGRRIRVVTLDSGVGAVFQEPVWSVNKRTFPKVFPVAGRADYLQVMRLLIALRGMQTSMYVPTFDEDLLATDGISSASDELTIENVGYTRFVRQREHKATVRLTFDDATTVTRTVTASSVVSVDEELLTVDTNWGVTKTVDEIVRVEFFELSRLAAPRVRVQHLGSGRARIYTPMVTARE